MFFHVGTLAGTAVGTVAGKAEGTVAGTAEGKLPGTAVGTLAGTAHQLEACVPRQPLGHHRTPALNLLRQLDTQQRSGLTDRVGRAIFNLPFFFSPVATSAK